MIDVNLLGAPLRREDFVKSSFSDDDRQGCLHIDRREGFVLLWEDGDPFAPEFITKVPNKSFVAFRDGMKAGEFDDVSV